MTTVMVTMRTLIVDDEPVARRRLRRLLRDASDVEIAKECGDGSSAIETIEKERLDLVLLDVQMPDVSGFDVVEALGRRMPPVIFVTAFDHYALEAFEVHAIDYLLKPVAEERFHQALDRARVRLRSDETGELHQRLDAMLNEIRSKGRYGLQIPVRSLGRILLVPVAEIDWVEAADNYAILHAGGREHLLRETMARLERSLDPERFVRIHRSSIVQLTRVRELLPSFQGDMVVVLLDGTRLPIGRTYRKKLERALGRSL